MHRRLTPLIAATLALGYAAAPTEAQQQRARAVGVAPGVLQPGPHNAITDVRGVRVGQTTVIVGDSIRTGVTAILPHPGNLFLDRVPAAIYVGNGFGKLLGSTQVAELGELDVRSIAAIKEASGGPVAEGSVGAGTGTVAFGWKGGIGSSSRLTGPADSRWTVGVLVQTNFGGDLHIMGVPVSRALHRNIAFSTHRDVRRRNGESRRSVAELDNDAMSGIFQAVVDATEEATLRSRHGTVHALPVAEVLGILRQHGALR